jgi:hypothetical protein
MLERRISSEDATPAQTSETLDAVCLALATLRDFANAESRNVALQHDNDSLPAYALAAHYAGADSITRRRFDALLRETESVAQTGLALIVGRSGRHDHGTIAAARFLGNSIAASLRRLENLLAGNPA